MGEKEPTRFHYDTYPTLASNQTTTAGIVTSSVIINNTNNGTNSLKRGVSGVIGIPDTMTQVGNVGVVGGQTIKLQQTSGKHKTNNNNNNATTSSSCSTRRICCSCMGSKSASFWAGLLTNLGICTLLFAYTLLGSFIFLAIEGGASTMQQRTLASTNRHHHNQLVKPIMRLDNVTFSSAALQDALEARQRIVENIWDITVSLNILYRENWTRLAALEIARFQDQLIKRLTDDMSMQLEIANNQNQQPSMGAVMIPQVSNNPIDYDWTFARAFLYSLTVLTTIGNLNQSKLRWRLRINAVPTIFPNLPSYFTKKVPTRMSPAVKQLWKSDILDSMTRAEVVEQKIHHINEIILSDKYSIRNFHLHVDEDKLTFYKVCWVSNSPFIDVSFSISRSFDVEIFVNNIRQKITHYQDILGYKFKCDLYSKLNQLIGRLNEYKSHDKSIEDHKTTIRTSFEVLKKCDDVDEETIQKLIFLNEQFDLIFTNINRYSSDLIIFSSMMLYTYPAAYNYLRNSQYLILPNPKYLKTFSQGNLQSGAAKDYLVKKYSKIEQHEKYVNLLLDEVHVKPAMTFKGNKIEGLASNHIISESSLTVAKSIQAFMITSLLSKNKDIVGLYPVQKMDSDYLHSKICEILEMLHSVGYEVVSIISDNNQVNRKTFKKFSLSGNLPICIDSPYLEGKKIFFLFDTVHLVKSIRNNWLNNKSKSFIFPNFNDSNIILTSKLSHLEAIYLKEKDLAIKLAPALAPKVLHPNSFERQNVSLALRIFDDKTIKAINCFRSILGEECVGTAEFLSTVRNWWTAVNVKTPSKGFHLREPLAVPITQNNKCGLQFLEQFCRWLQDWSNLENSNKLTKETQSALLHTTTTLCQIADYLLQNLKFKYVLFGKFQTDKLEARFGQYRQMTGCCYNVTVQQILQSEKKLKLLSLLKLVKSKNEFFNFKTNFNFSSSSIIEVVGLDNILSHAENICFDQEICSAMMYISGYVGRKVTGKLNCDECVGKLITTEDLAFEFTAETEYLKDLDRGSLKYPTEFSISFGYGSIAPKTTLGRVVTLAYALLGIPLTLVYLSSTGGVLARVARGVFSRALCCCLCSNCGYCCYDEKRMAEKERRMKRKRQQEEFRAQQLALQEPYYVRSGSLHNNLHSPEKQIQIPEIDSLSASESRTSMHGLSLLAPILLCLCMMIIYIVAGAVALYRLEGWPLLDGIYFCFMSLSTIGFGDLVPGLKKESTTTIWFCSIYIMSGMALTAMCFNVLHEEILHRLKHVSSNLNDKNNLSLVIDKNNASSTTISSHQMKSKNFNDSSDSEYLGS